jgi:hypothetical protein
MGVVGALILAAMQGPMLRPCSGPDRCRNAAMRRRHAPHASPASARRADATHESSRSIERKGVEDAGNAPKLRLMSHKCGILVFASNSDSTHQSSTPPVHPLCFLLPPPRISSRRSARHQTSLLVPPSVHLAYWAYRHSAYRHSAYRHSAYRSQVVHLGIPKPYGQQASCTSAHRSHSSRRCSVCRCRRRRSAASSRTTTTRFAPSHTHTVREGDWEEETRETSARGRRGTLGGVPLTPCSCGSCGSCCGR